MRGGGGGEEEGRRQQGGERRHGENEDASGGIQMEHSRDNYIRV